MSDPWAEFTPAPPVATPGALSPSHDPWAEFTPAPARPQPGVRFAPQGTPGQDGLVWGKDGGRDPKSGELVVAGKPMTQNAPSQGLAVTSSALSGVPIVGPSLEKAAVKAGAFVRNLLYGDPADQTESAVQGDVARSQAAYPKTSTAAGIGGAVVGTAPAVAMAPEMFGAGGGSMLGRVAVGAATGADIGGLDAAVRSGGDVGETFKGASAGGAAGAAGPVIGAGISRVADAVGRGLGRATAPLPAGVSRPAAEIVSRAAEADGATAGAGAARIAEAGPQGMIADAGPGVATVLDTAMQRGGPGTVGARQAIEQRAAATGRELGGALDEALGPERGIHTSETAIRESTAAARQSAYDAAYGTPIDYSSAAGRTLEDVVRNRVPPMIIRRAENQMRIDGTPTRQSLLRINPDGSATLERMPDVRQIDYITRSLNDVARMGDGQGALGGNTAEGRSYGNLARELRNTLRQAVPEYGHALETAAEPIQARNALEFGSEILRPTVARDVAAEMIGHMTGPELTQARSGLRAMLSEAMANVQRTITDPNVDAREAMASIKALSSRAAQEKMALLIGEGEAGARTRGLQEALTRATRAQELRGAVTTNSRTFARTATNDAVQEASQPSALARLLGGEPLQAGKATARFLTGQTPADMAARQDAIYGELAHLLTGPRGPAAASTLERILGTQGRIDRWGSISDRMPLDALSSTGLLALLPSFNDRSRLVPHTP